jgi:formylglycine-generating enzyme required for sulfatase activity
MSGDLNQTLFAIDEARQRQIQLPKFCFKFGSGLFGVEGNQLRLMAGNLLRQCFYVSPGAQRYLQPAPIGSFPNGASAYGVHQMVGDVWEWTSSTFDGYPGFAAWPYREYSEVFFGDGYRVLRGGSWAADRRVATTTFRNWDLPERRQIFSGVRLAR